MFQHSPTKLKKTIRRSIGIKMKLMSPAQGHSLYPSRMIWISLVFKLWPTSATVCPFRKPIMIRNAAVFMIAPKVIQSMNHFKAVFLMFSLLFVFRCEGTSSTPSSSSSLRSPAFESRSFSTSRSSRGMDVYRPFVGVAYPGKERSRNSCHL